LRIKLFFAARQPYFPIHAARHGQMVACTPDLNQSLKNATVFKVIWVFPPFFYLICHCALKPCRLLLGLPTIKYKNRKKNGKLIIAHDWNLPVILNTTKWLSNIACRAVSRFLLLIRNCGRSCHVACRSRYYQTSWTSTYRPEVLTIFQSLALVIITRASPNLKIKHKKPNNN